MHTGWPHSFKFIDGKLFNYFVIQLSKFRLGWVWYSGTLGILRLHLKYYTCFARMLTNAHLVTECCHEIA